jgi:hypothetical protein
MRRCYYRLRDCFDADVVEYSSAVTGVDFDAAAGGVVNAKDAVITQLRLQLDGALKEMEATAEVFNPANQETHSGSDVDAELTALRVEVAGVKQKLAVVHRDRSC